MKSQDNYPTWKGYLFRLQQEAPKPKPVFCQNRDISNRPSFYGRECHGLLSRDEGENLCKEEGSFLIRESQTERGRFTLVLRVLGVVKNFKLYYEGGMHFVGEKRFESVYDLAEDGLITMYVEKKAQNYIEQMTHEPVYNSLSRYSLSRGKPAKPHDYPVAPNQQEQRRVYSSAYNESRSPRSKNYVTDLHHYENTPVAMQDEAADMTYGNEYMTSNAGHYVTDVPPQAAEYYRYYGDVTQDQSTGTKKNLTPTSSDERKQRKKRIATEDAKNNQQYHQQTIVAERSEGYNQNVFHVNGRHASRMNAPEDGYYGQPPLPHVRGFGDSGHSLHEERTDSPQHQYQQHQHHQEIIEYPSLYGQKPPQQREKTSLEQILAVHRRLEEEGSDFTPDPAIQERPKIAHARQSSEPVELFQHSRGSSIDSQEQRFNQSANFGVSKEAFIRRKLSFHARNVPDKAGSIGSCGSELSNASSGSSATHNLHENNGYLPDIQTHRSSEGERNTPSPRHVTGVQRRASGSPRLGYSSASNLVSRESRQRKPVANLPSSESPWQPRRDTNQGHVTPPQARQANRGERPRGHRMAQNIQNPNYNDVMTGEQNGEVEKRDSKKKAYRRSKSDFVASPQKRIGGFVEDIARQNKEVSNSDEICQQIEVNVPISPTRHSSESACSENRKLLGDRKPSAGNLPGARAWNQRSPNVDSKQPKPMQRRATTTDLESATRVENNGVFPNNNKPRKPINEINLEARPKRSSSPTKQKKMVTSPPSQIRSVTSSPSKNFKSKCSPAHQYEKEHHYKSHTYRGLQWCEYCGNFMWGIIQQGVQCIDCGLNVHKQCAKLVPNDCQPELKHIKHVFGVDLTTLVKLHSTQRPLVVDLCISEIESRGMDVEGIYRVPGSHQEIADLKTEFNQFGSDVDLTSYDDVNTIAGSLKLYLRELPVPLLPYQLYSRFINAAKISRGDGKLDAIKMALSAMPGAHLETLKFIINHLGRVSEYSSINQMDSHNLGIVFGPTLLRAPEKDAHAQYNLNDTPYQQDVIGTMIECRQQLFGPA